MAFENINVNSLRAAINSCKSSINYSGSEQVILTISNDNNWNTMSRDNLKKALNNLVDVKYDNLIKKLDNCLNALKYIEEYKELEAENNQYHEKMRQLDNSLNDSTQSVYVVQRGDTLSKIARKYNTTVGDIMGINDIANANKIYSGQKIKIPNGNEGIQSEINELANLTNENQREMNSLKNKAYNALL